MLGCMHYDAGIRGAIKVTIFQRFDQNFEVMHQLWKSERRNERLVKIDSRRWSRVACDCGPGIIQFQFVGASEMFGESRVSGAIALSGM